MFAPGASPATAINAVVAANGRIIWMNPRATMIAVRLESSSGVGTLYRSGALLVTRSPVLAGCVSAIAR